MKRFLWTYLRSSWLRSPLVTLGFTLLLATPVFAQGTSPWENAVSMLQQAFTSTITRDLIIVTILVAAAQAIAIVLIDLGRAEAINYHIRGLARQSLLRDKTVEISQKKTPRVVTLTKTGHRLLRKTNQLPDDQPIYHGLVKPREVKHDADLYRLYQKEAARIERSGGRPVRVLFDHELKRNLSRDLALLGPKKDDPDRKQQVAEKHRLQVVNGKIPVPDLRVEYETPELELRHVDLELATRDYRPRAMAEKAAAGFSLYGRSEDASRLRHVLDEREITARILLL